MKKMLAVALVSVMMFTSTIGAFAAEDVEPSGHTSPTYEELKKELEQAQKDLEKASDDIKDLKGQVNGLIKALQAKGSSGSSGNSGSGGGNGGGSSRPTPPSNPGNYVNYGGTVVYQGGKIEINGGRSNVTFTIKVPAEGVRSSANTLAGKVGGTLLACVNTSSPGVAFTNAKVNFFVSGAEIGDNIAAYQNQNGSWVQLPVVEIRKDHVIVNMTRHGDIAFVRVPVLASVTN